jgi:Chaperone of endosialidase
MKTHTTSAVFILLALLCLPLGNVQSVNPPPDGGYPGGNTAEGQAALLSLTTGGFNTAVGFFSLRSNTEGQFNTGVGAGTLLANTAHQNTATGAGALLNNTLGVKNTADGAFALFYNTMGNSNTASGVAALFGNTEGFSNTAVGYNALLSNTTAGDNTAVGTTAMFSNDTGEFNTAIGSQSLRNNVDGDSNTAIGDSAGFNITGNGNVCIGAGVNGFPGENNITRIRNVYETVATDRAVYVTADNRIGTLSSSRRYKDEITPMEGASQAIHSLRPVTFRYKKEIDAARRLSFGLIAEDVSNVDPSLVTLDREGKPQTVRYEAVNAMLLNEFLKEHRKVQEQQAAITDLKSVVAQLQKQVQAAIAEQRKELASVLARLKEQDSKIQTVSAQHALNQRVSRIVSNGQ